MRTIKVQEVQSFDGKGLGRACSDPETTLESLDNALFPHGLEVVFVDNGSTDRWYLIQKRT